MLIATRTLYARTSTNTASEKGFDIRLFQPERDGPAFRCRYEIDWPKGARKSAGTGKDSVQSLVIALQKIGVELYTSSYHTEGRLRFEEFGQGYGFPIPKPMRDQLIGDDARFEGNQ